jgi:hypothetical protein
MAGARDFSRYEAVLDFKVPRALVQPATRWRSTWIIASIQTLKERGHYARYEGLLAPPHRDAVLLSVAGVWLPMPVALAHYAACDALGLVDDEVRAMARRSAERAQGTVLDTAVRLARGAGVSPWTIFPHMQRLWERGADGGAAAVYKLGPKESVVHTVGCTLFDVRYFRLAFAGVVLGVVRLFCTQAYVHDVTAPGHHECALRFQWV